MADEPPSSPPGPNASLEESVAYYKSQYEQLEQELEEFQKSSKELEEELERDVESSEKRERTLKEKIESLGFEVDEWKAKCKQSKTEANSAQNLLQKEITTLRDTTRNLQLKLRDIEVANDDFERQARNTSSSLEDVESKYTVALERSILLETEIQAGDQERESLRIESQRLRDELSDLRIEAEITQDKLRRAESAAGRQSIMAHGISTAINAPHSPVSETSPATAASSPVTAASPRPKSTSTGISSTPTPPSPPASESSVQAISTQATPDKPLPKSRLSLADNNTTPRPGQYSMRPPRHSRGPSIPVSNGRTTPSVPRRTSLLKQPGMASQSHGVPQSSSLRQIRGLIGQMQRLEQRVHSARSKLPGPVNTPPGASPRSGSALGHMSTNVTLRSGKRRTGGSNVSSMRSELTGDTTPLSTAHVSRLSLGGLPPTDRPAASRPSSRASAASRTSTHQSHSGYPRPSSRASQTGARTPLGHYADVRRPRSSMGGTYGSQNGHNFSTSRNGGTLPIEEMDKSCSTPTPRRSLIGGQDLGSAIPTPSTLSRRQSGSLIANVGTTPGRRTSSGYGMREAEEGDMRPPSRMRKLSGVGETY
ncbi:MAG: NADH:ubiquinone oxidoreductase [Vezdaea aestivalis]|nr:MAG: NADH:ubiquinone oxidoreductase [Vezdaea aestivalis]